MDNPLLTRGKELPKILGVFLIYCLSLALFSFGVARVVFTLLTLDSKRPPDYLRYTIQTGRSPSTGFDASEERGERAEEAVIDLDIMTLRNPFAIPVRLSAVSQTDAQVPSPSFARIEQQPAGAAETRQLESFSRETAVSGEVAPLHGLTAVPFPLLSALTEAGIGQRASDSTGPARESLQADQLPPGLVAGFSSAVSFDPFAGPRSYIDEAAQTMTTGALDSRPVDETIARLLVLRRAEPVGFTGGTRPVTELVDACLLSSTEARDLLASRQAIDMAGWQYREDDEGSQSTLTASSLRRPVVDIAMPITHSAASVPLEHSSSGSLADISTATGSASAAFSPWTAVPGGLGRGQAPPAVAQGTATALSDAASGASVGSGPALPADEPRIAELAPIAVARIAGIAGPPTAGRDSSSAASKSVLAPTPDSAGLSPSQGSENARGAAPGSESTSVPAEEGTGEPQNGMVAAEEHETEKPHQNSGSVTVAKPKVPVVADTPEFEPQASIAADEPAKAEWPPIAVTGVIVTGDGVSSATIRLSGKPQVIRQGDRLRLGDQAGELEVVFIGRDLVELRLGDDVRQYRIGDGPDE